MNNVLEGEVKGERGSLLREAIVKNFEKKIQNFSKTRNKILLKLYKMVK